MKNQSVNAELGRRSAKRRARRTLDQERKVEQISAEIGKLDRLLADPKLYASDAAGAQRAGMERGVLAKRLADAEAEWLAAAQAYESAERQLTPSAG